MRADEPLAGAQLGERGMHVIERTAHPLQPGVLETLPDQRRAHIKVAENAAVVALGRVVEFDPVVLDGSGLELLGDARPGFRLQRKDFLDGLSHRHSH